MAEGAEGVIPRKRKRKRFSKRPPDGPFGPNAAWIHGGCGTPEYGAYNAAKTLCANPKNPRWVQYGGRGIKFLFASFASFMEHLGRRPAGKVLDRIDRDGHFEVGNVYWRRKRRKKRRMLQAKAPKPARIVVKKPPRVKLVNVCGHPERRHYAKGKCWPCYIAGLRAEGRLRQKVKAICHPERPHMAKGLCAMCYAATPERRAWQNAYAAARRVPKPRRPRTVNTCGHPDRPHQAKGRCQSCYDAMRSGPTDAKEIPGTSPADL